MTKTGTCATTTLVSRLLSLLFAKAAWQTENFGKTSEKEGSLVTDTASSAANGYAANGRALTSPKKGLVRGHLPALLANPLEFLSGCARDHGDVVPLRVGPKHALLISNPTDVEHVLLRSSDDFSKPFAVRGDQVGEDNEQQATADIWRRPHLARTVFHRSCADTYGRVMSDSIQQELDSWQDGESRDFARDMNRLAFDIAARALFGSDARSQAGLVAEALPVVMDEFLERGKTLFLVPQWLPTPAHRRLNKGVAALDNAIARVLAMGGEREDGSGGMLRLVAEAEAGGAILDPARVRSEALTFLLAGYETVATTLAWAWLLLGKHPEIADALSAEVDHVLGGRPASAADIERLPYARAVVEETLRLYPPIWIIVRTAKRDTRLNGHFVRKGTFVLASPWVIHRDARHFEKPETFNPARWSPELRRALPKFAYFPFGGGRRGCVGRDFAILEAILVLASTMQRFRVPIASDGEETPIHVSVTLRPQDGITWTVRRRDPYITALRPKGAPQELVLSCPVSHLA